VPNASPAFLSYGPSIAVEHIGSDLVERMIEGWRKADLEIAGAVSPKAAAALLFALAIIREARRNRQSPGKSKLGSCLCVAKLLRLDAAGILSPRLILLRSRR